MTDQTLNELQAIRQLANRQQSKIIKLEAMLMYLIENIGKDEAALVVINELKNEL